MYKEGDMVKVYWIDSVSHSGWGAMGDDSMNCISVGIAYMDEDDYIVIYQSQLLDNSDNISNRGDYLQIPKVAIKLVAKLVETQWALIDCPGKDSIGKPTVTTILEYMKNLWKGS